MPSDLGPSNTATAGPPKAAPFAFGDVVLVPFPFTSQAAAKQRPAVVVSSSAYAIERPDVVLMAITSQLRPSPAPTGVNWGEAWIADWQAAGLLKPSAVKPIFATFEQRLVLRALGALTPADAKALADAIARILGPPPPAPPASS
jgi:mRNA interferase MazF